MAEEDGADRTEAATPRRLQQALEAGQLPVSRETAPLATLAAGLLLIAVWLPGPLRTLAAELAALLAQAGTLTPHAAGGLALRAGLTFAAPFVGVAALTAAAATLAQTGGRLHAAALLPDSPASRRAAAWRASLPPPRSRRPARRC
jgi:flagellar biosynthetic protein FlhB